MQREKPGMVLSPNRPVGQQNSHTRLLDWQDPRGVTGREMPRSETGLYAGDGNKGAPSGGREQVAPLALFIRTISLLVVWKMYGNEKETRGRKANEAITKIYKS